jgi:hypothetical protein
VDGAGGLPDSVGAMPDGVRSSHDGVRRRQGDVRGRPRQRGSSPDRSWPSFKAWRRITYMQQPIPVHRVAACSEFPNDNPALHLGSIWVALAIGSPPGCELPVQGAEVQAAPAAVAVWGEGNDASGDQDNAPDDDAEPIEIVDDLGFDEVESEIESMLTIGAGHAQAPAGEAVAADPFLTLVTVVKDVAVSFGADPSSAAQLDSLLGLQSSDEAVPPQALAWRGILRGESEDYEACGSASLDEWAADVVARVLGGATRADGIRRELRRRGVAAFGMVA